ncbi:MAG TPA: hypothetical protein VFC46_13650 [Humisphaera sp.]|nr:hypothetical protein [Humisphaera sp.]
MSCEIYRQFALDHGWDEATRRNAADTLQHLESCVECQQAVQDYDRLRLALESFAAHVDPPMGLDQFNRPSEPPAPRPIRAPLPTQNLRLPSRWRMAWTAAAASIFLAAGVAFEMGQASARPISPQPFRGSFSAEHAFSALELSPELDEFGQLSNFYDGHASWMALTKTTTDFGLCDLAQPLGRQALVLRLTLTRGPELTSRADLLIIPGQTANFTVPGHYAPDLHYRVTTSAENPSLVALSLEMTAPTIAEPLAGLATNLQLQAGEKLTAGRMVTAYGEYDLNISFAYAELPERNQ